MSTLLISCAAVAFASPPNPDDLHAMGYAYPFDNYVNDFFKVYVDDAEYSRRQAIFEKNLLTIQAHNTKNASTYEMGVNDFTDLEPKEFVSMYLGKAKGTDDGEIPWAECPSAKNFTAPDKLPASLDWRTQGVVTPPKNQGACGSCWAFSTAETLESHIAIKTGKLMEFSPQEFVDCVANPNQCGGTGGCQGATQWLGFEYAIKNGVTTEADYPYTARTMKCDKAKLKPVANISGYCRLPHVSKDYTAEKQYADMLNAVNVVGPIAISVAAEPWQFYGRGIFSKDCGSDIDHAVQLVGYGSELNSDYWLVRNSWGGMWGEKGYIRIERFGSKKTIPCVEDKTPGDGTGCKGGPSELEICGECGILSDSSYPVGGRLINPSVEF